MSTTSVNSLHAAYREQRIQAYVFAWVAGYVDAHALLRFQVYASFMSGNTTRAGVEAVAGHSAEAALNLLAVLMFVAGAFLGAVLFYARQATSGFSSVVVALLLLIIDSVAGMVGIPPWLSVALLSTAMGSLNSGITRVGRQPINIGYVSGGLYKLAEHLALAYRRVPVENPTGLHDTHFHRAALLVAIWTMFLCGGISGALVERFVPAAGIWLAAAALACVLTVRGARTLAQNRKTPNAPFQ